MSFFAGNGGRSGSGNHSHTSQSRSHGYSNGHSYSHGQSHGHGFGGIGKSKTTRSRSDNFFSRPTYARSSSSFFSRLGSSSSSYKRRPRDGYITYLMAKLKRLLADLWYYAQKHPMKAFFAVVVPLISAGGALHGLLKQFGVRLPDVFDGAANRGYRGGGGGYYGSSGYGYDSRYSGGGGGDAFGAMGSLAKIAQAFM